MYNYYCMFYEAEKPSPNLIIIPINWASFCLLWANNEDLFRPEISAFAPFSPDLGPGCQNPIRLRGINPMRQLEYKLRIMSVYPKGMKLWVLKKLGMDIPICRKSFKNQRLCRQDKSETCLSTSGRPR